MSTPSQSDRDRDRAQPQAHSVPLSRPSSRLPNLTLVRSTDTHPPHHAHFDIPEGPPSPPPQSQSHPHPHPSRPGSPTTTSASGRESGAHLAPVLDIEHVPVDDDPREWSNSKKNFVLALMTIAVLGPLIAPSIYNPVIDEVKADLHASETEIGLSLSLYIIFQGWVPVLWASIAEIIGRKIVYLTSYAFYVVGALVASRATTMPVFIIMRCLQAFGSSAVVAVGAGSLADMFEVHERGQKLGMFYGMPLLGPSIGPLIGGALGNAFGWRASFYFLTAFAGCCEVLFIFFPDTWRKERSRVYQKAMERAVKRAMAHDASAEKKRAKKAALGLASTAATPATTTPGTPVRRDSVGVDAEQGAVGVGSVGVGTGRDPEVMLDLEQKEVVVKRSWWRFGRKRTEEEHETIRPSVRDVNPLPTMASIFKRPTNALILFSSGLLFSAQYTITYTASITLARAPYDYNALIIGVVILSFGVGSVIGSIGGGKYSDLVLRRLKKANGGVSQPEMRLKATIPAMPLLVAASLTYAWTAEKHVNVAALIVALFFFGFSLMIIYASTLAYLVDANPGRSASAVSCNSFVRGSFGCILSQTALPIQNAMGDGGLYTLFAGLLALSSAGICLLAYKGESWRQEGHRWPWQRKVDERDGQRDKQEEMGRDQEVKGDISGMASPTTTAAGDSDVVKGKQTESDEKSVGGA